jgi:hypothetical protein
LIRTFNIHRVKDACTQLTVGYIVTESTAKDLNELPRKDFCTWAEVRIFFDQLGATAGELAKAMQVVERSGHGFVQIVNAQEACPVDPSPEYAGSLGNPTPLLSPASRRPFWRPYPAGPSHVVAPHHKRGLVK